MPLRINLVDIPSEGLSIDCGVESSEINLSAEDGAILGSVSCEGHVFSTDDHLAVFQGTLTGNVVRECVRCLMNFKENVAFQSESFFPTQLKEMVTQFPL